MRFQNEAFTFIITSFWTRVIHIYAPNTNAEEDEVERFHEDLQDLLELIPQKDAFFIIEVWNAKVESQEIPGVTGIFSLGVQNEAGQRLIEFCQENALVIANTHSNNTREDSTHYITKWSTPKSD